MTTITLNNPSALIATCAPLLGFHPTNGDLVGLVTGVPGRPGPVAMRTDIPRAGWTRGLARAVAVSVAGTMGEVIHLVHFVDVHGQAPNITASLGAETVADAFENAGLVVGSSYVTNGERWWSTNCHLTCCPLEGAPLDEAELARVQAELVAAGMPMPVASRDQFADSIRPDPERVAEVADAMTKRAQMKRPTTLSAEQIVARLDDPQPAQVARILASLQNLRVRDQVLQQLILKDRDEQREAVRCLGDMLRHIPTGAGAPVATLVALLAWKTGLGALATDALERAFHEDPDYRLAALARSLITAGLDPEVWANSIRNLDI